MYDWRPCLVPCIYKFKKKKLYIHRAQHVEIGIYLLDYTGRVSTYSSLNCLPNTIVLHFQIYFNTEPLTHPFPVIHFQSFSLIIPNNVPRLRAWTDKRSYNKHVLETFYIFMFFFFFIDYPRMKISYFSINIHWLLAIQFCQKNVNLLFSKSYYK